MLYTEKEKNEIERVRKVFEKHIQQMTAYDLVCSNIRKKNSNCVAGIQTLEMN